MTGVQGDQGPGGRSVLGPRSTYKGELDSTGPVEIGGSFDGRISAESVVVEPAGEVRGSISAPRITIRGRFEGDMTAEEVKIVSGAVVQGSVVARRLSIEPGAEVDFACKMPVAA